MKRIFIDKATGVTATILGQNVLSQLLFADGESPLLSKKDPLVWTETTQTQQISVAEGRVIGIKSGGVFKAFLTEGETLGESDIIAESGETQAFVHGKDYYVYLCDDGGNGALKISTNSTCPTGWTADNTKKIGGFHVGTMRNVNADGIPGYGDPLSASFVAFKPTSEGSLDGPWETEVVHQRIVPRSVWDLHHRPKCSPEGMVEVETGLWADIYQSSAATTIELEFAESGTIADAFDMTQNDYRSAGFVKAGKLQSKYGGTPVTGTEGLNSYNFEELARMVGKRLPTYAEWCKAAFGSPSGRDGNNDYAWSKTTNTARRPTGCSVDSDGNFTTDTGLRSKPYAVSAVGCCDCCGNVWEWLSDMFWRGDLRNSSGTYSLGDWWWKDGTKDDGFYPTLGRGSFFGRSINETGRLLAGGNWANGAGCGARSVSLRLYAWCVRGVIGCRLFSESLAR